MNIYTDDFQTSSVSSHGYTIPWATRLWRQMFSYKPQNMSAAHHSSGVKNNLFLRVWEQRSGDLDS